MTSRDRRHRQDSHEILDMPIPRHNCVWRDAQEYHASNADQCEENGEFEAFGNLGDFEEEIAGFDFFGCCAPGHIVGEHVGEQGGTDVKGEATEEDAEQEGPPEVEEDWVGR